MASGVVGDKEKRGEEEEKGEDGEGRLSLLVCDICGHSDEILCTNCGGFLCQTQVNVGRAGNVNYIDHQIEIYQGHFTDYSRGQDGATCALKRSSHGGNLYVEKTKKLTIPQHQTIINLGTYGKQVKVNVVDDSEQVEDALDGVFMLKNHWTDTGPNRTQAPTEVLLTQMINESSSDFFLQIFAEIMKADVPQNVIRILYEKFRLRLLGLTKSLEFLMEVDKNQVDTMMKMKMQEEVQRELSYLVPESQRGQVTWRKFAHIPVQCQDDERRQREGEQLSCEVEEDGVETVRGALNLACVYGNQETLKRLLGHRHADVQARNDHGQSLFHVACRNGQSHLLDLLLEGGAAIHEPDSEGRSALHHAYGTDVADDGKRWSTVRWLVSHGADVHAVDSDGHTPLDLAKMGGYGSMLELLVSGQSVSPPP